MKKALVLYYTCSNNTLAVSKGTQEILEHLDWEVRLYDLRSYDGNKESFEPDLLFLGVPVHYWEIPDAALSMIKRLPQFNNSAGFVFSTFGKCVSNCVPYHLARELRLKGVSILGGAQFAMPHSARMDPNTRIGDVETAFGKGEPTDENWGKYKLIVQHITQRVENGDLVPIDINRLKKLHTKGASAKIACFLMTMKMRRSGLPYVQHDEEKCKQCYSCVSNCDYQAITLSDEKDYLINKKACKRCYKCVEVCQTKALYYNWDKAIYWARFAHRMAKNTETMFLT